MCPSSSRPGPSVASVIPLRAGVPRARYLERRRLEHRLDACKFGTPLLERLIDDLGLTDGAVGELFGGEKAGSGIRHGSIPVTPEEAILLFPSRLAAAQTAELWLKRLDRETANDNSDVDALRLQLARLYLLSFRAVLVDGDHFEDLSSDLSGRSPVWSTPQIHLEK